MEKVRTLMDDVKQHIGEEQGGWFSLEGLKNLFSILEQAEEMVEKQTAKEIIKSNSEKWYRVGKCPTCDIELSWKSPYCYICGQKLL